MSKKQRSMQKELGTLQCPVCPRFINYIPEIRGLGLAREDVILPEPGDLTQCDRCGVVLEFGGDPTSLTLRPAPNDRIKAFNELAREVPPEPSLSELVGYTMKHRQMPERHRIGHRFRRIIRFTAVNDNDE